MNYLLSEKSKKGLDSLLADQCTDMTPGRRKARPSVSSVGGGDYSGMFAVTRKDDTTVTIAEGIIILGLTTLAFSEADLTITADGYVYMDIVWGGAAYTATPANAASLPAQTNTHYYIPLAAVDFTDSKVGTITQIRYGAIEGSGRVF